MSRYVAFLRAINVGGHVVKMEKLRALFEELGFANVSTLVASGNVIFETPITDTASLEKQIEEHLSAALGYAVVTFLRTARQLTKILELQPFPAAEVNDADTVLYIGFLSTPPSKAAIDKLMTFSTRDTELRVRDREVYWLARVKLSESRFTGAKMERALGMPTTLRNVSTVRKAIEAASAPLALQATEAATTSVATRVSAGQPAGKPVTKRGGDRRRGDRRAGGA